MICELVRRGLRVGVSAVSHKVIRNLLDAVMKEAKESESPVNCVQKVADGERRAVRHREVTDNGDVLDRLRRGSAQVAAGTAWLWARPEFHEAVDVLFVDEAGQMSLANVLAVSQGAKSVVLLGDPQQLEQPQQGTHPEGTDVSALDHILQGHKTIPDDRGIFLPETMEIGAEHLCLHVRSVLRRTPSARLRDSSGRFSSARLRSKGLASGWLASRTKGIRTARSRRWKRSSASCPCSFARVLSGSTRMATRTR